MPRKNITPRMAKVTTQPMRQPRLFITVNPSRVHWRPLL
jgi:hypothetical protein